MIIGADRFYANGFTGTRAIASNVEGGLTWNGHETLNGVNTFLYSIQPSILHLHLDQIYHLNKSKDNNYSFISFSEEESYKLRLIN